MPGKVTLESSYCSKADSIRLQAQQDAVGMVAQAKLRSKPEDPLGSIEMFLTLTTDHGKALAKIH